MGVWLASVGTVGFLVSESESYKRDIGLPAASVVSGRGNSISHCRDALHTPLSNCLACLLGSNTGLSEGVFGYNKTSTGVETLSSSNYLFAQSIRCLWLFIDGIPRIPSYKSVSWLIRKMEMWVSSSILKLIVWSDVCVNLLNLEIPCLLRAAWSMRPFFAAKLSLRDSCVESKLTSIVNFVVNMIDVSSEGCGTIIGDLINK